MTYGDNSSCVFSILNLKDLPSKTVLRLFLNVLNID